MPWCRRIRPFALALPFSLSRARHPFALAEPRARLAPPPRLSRDRVAAPDTAGGQPSPTPAPAGDAGELANLTAFVGDMLQQATTLSTKKALATALRHFDSFLSAASDRKPLVTPRYTGDIQATLYNEETFMLFAAYLATTPSKRKNSRALKPRTADTILNYVASVRSHLAALNGFLLTSELPRWKRFVRGLRRDFSTNRRLSAGFRAVNLKRAFPGRPPVMRTVFEVNVWALLATGWHVLARPKELQLLTRADLSFETTPRHHAVIMLSHACKKKPGQQKVPVMIAAADGSGADALQALVALVHLDPVLPRDAASTPLFRDGNGRPFTPTATAALVRHAAAKAGVPNPRDFGGRSLRVGGATDLHATGVPASNIQRAHHGSNPCHAHAHSPRPRRARPRALVKRDLLHLHCTRACHAQLLEASAGMHTATDESLEERMPDYIQPARL